MTKYEERTDPSIACNCYRYSEHISGIDLPPMATLTPNTEPGPGTFALFDYRGVPHVALVTAVSSSTVTLDEANYRHCTTGVRTIPLDYPHLRGFYGPG